jgi:molybdopterin-guanine dinucleotide biosynthesis protein A
VNADGVLLTGGTSRRLGLDKATLLVDGETLAVRAARVLAAVCPRAVEVGPGASPLHATRESPPGSGPLAALVAGADTLGAATVVVLAVDLPRVEVPLLQLVAGWPGDGSVLPVAEGRPQPVCARWGAVALARGRAALAAGDRSLHALADGDDVTTLDESVWRRVAPDDAFADVDTPDDVVRLGLVIPLNEDSAT